jgi:hypothetical protein
MISGIKTALITRKCVGNGLIIIAIIHILYLLAQSLKIVTSENVYFPISGSNGNPTVTALYLVGILPILFSRMRDIQWRLWYMGLALLTIIGIYILHCRTAYIGLLVEVIVLIGMQYHKMLRSFLARPFWFCLITFMTAIIATIACVNLYNMKKDSADGRLLIWKLSADMIKERPLGHGYGLFEKHYNLRQAEYFSKRTFSETERRNADFVYMPYNDYIEHGVEGGIIGMIFLTTFYIITINKAIKNGMKIETAILTAFCVMSFTNFVYSSIQPWLLVICISASAMAGTERIERQHKKLSHAALLTNISVLALLFLALYNIVYITKAQITLRRLDACMREGKKVSDSLFFTIESRIGSSEAYWTRRTKNSMSKGDYGKAMEYIRKARQYSSLPELLNIEAECLWQIGKREASMCRIDTLSNMLPRVLGIKLVLMRYNSSIGKKRTALHLADDIVATGAKIYTKEASTIIQEAIKYKDTHEK